MKLNHLLLIALFLTPFAGMANHSIFCGDATVKRPFHERRHLSRFATALKVAAETEHPTYPWQFELIWMDTVGYLWQEKVTGAYLMIKGDAVAISSPLDDAKVNQWVEIAFPRSLKRFWFASLQSKNVLDANREILAKWFTRSVYPILISHDFEKAAAALETRELTLPEFSHLVRRLSLVQNIIEIPPYELKKRDGKRVKLRVTFSMTDPDKGFVIYTHGRFDKFSSGATFLKETFGTEFVPTRAAWHLGHLFHYESPGVKADVFNIHRHNQEYPNDSLADLLYGLEEISGGVLLDIYPATGHFSLENDSIQGQRNRAIWKKWLESLIRDHGLAPISEEILLSR